MAAAAAGGCGTADPGPASPPRPASALSSEAGRLLGGGVPAFQAQLRALRGKPVVVNQWASWCGPCRFEFPFLARAAERYRGRVAFLGVDAKDARPAAERFLVEQPLPYPSYFDPATDIAREFRGGQFWPTTAYYDARGRLVYTHAGVYSSQAKLEEEIRRHALRGV